MNFSSKIKAEIIENGLENPCCQVAAVAGILRASGAIEVRQGKLGFTFVGEAQLVDFFAKTIKTLYGVDSLITRENETRAMLEAFGDKAADVLVDLGIVLPTSSGISVDLNIGGYIIENDCCKKAFVRGAFLGSGTVTVPKMDKPTTTGYHLEFVFSQYKTSDGLCDLLAELGFSAKLISRKEYYVVYIKNAEEIKDMLALFGANRACMELADIIIRKEIKNKTNRAVNCELSNLNKQIDASIRSREDIEVIAATIGLSGLPLPLKSVAEARQRNSEASLLELAEILQISKSCLCHRLRRIGEIAAELK